MTHVAIMKKDLGFIPMILSGEKTIESRWYLHKRSPWGKIAPGDTIYFKNSGEGVSAKATAAKILHFENPDGQEIIRRYGKQIGLKSAPENKKYCILIFLKHPQKVKPFNINKKGFGAMSAWLAVEDVEKIRR